jgi:hypothetical protein
MLIKIKYSGVDSLFQKRKFKTKYIEVIISCFKEVNFE